MRGALIALGIVVVICLGAAGAYIWSWLRVPDLDVSSSAAQEESLAEIDRWLTTLHSSNKFNGGVVVVSDGVVLMQQTYGVADVDAEQPLTNQSSFRLASVSKQFTAAAILVLAEQGRLDLDQPVSEVLVDFPYPHVTVRHLLNHTSGLADNYMALAKRHRDDLGEILRIADVVALTTQHPAQPEAPPGTSFSYSNTNYVLLAGVVEAVSGSPFEQFMSNELFEPLGMEHSRVWNLASDEPTFPGKVTDFDQFNDERDEVPPTWLDGVAGDGAVFSSLDDLIIWADFWNDSPLVSPELLEEAFTDPQLSDGERAAYGFGWVLEADHSWHNGSWLGARTFVRRGADGGSFVAIVDNSSNPRLGRIASDLVAAVDAMNPVE